mmetsp:Transcript_8412/g.12717  ORF Transcript_8412/g.12717 Transcript_8412/m.12717 type:complete len:119 (-) Transcript_8412:549-905(-)
MIDIETVAFLAVFFVLSLLSSNRIYLQSLSSGGETSDQAIKILNFLIFFCSITRFIFFILKLVLQKTNQAPEDVVFDGDGAVKVVIHQIILSSGTISIFSIFILFAVYWKNLVKKTDF